MEIYLIRHTTPDIPKGICYGQSDLGVAETFEEELASIIQYLPNNIQNVYSSPLKRCSKLATALFPKHSIQLKKELQELNFGLWEMKRWDDIPQPEIQSWMKDFVHVQVPGGESYIQLHKRVVNCFKWIASQAKPTVVITHGGVLRSILSNITNTPLSESFDVFSCQYGCVIKLIKEFPFFEMHNNHKL
ncbi:MAG: alpha-ribazole phosphatase [Chitinophagaceae bacterium]|nr:alpha-ribazole phosphatase [Chitinophagaceae bacterium]